MISNGGCDPFHYVRGRGGLGYKPSPPFMHGLGYDYGYNLDGCGLRGGMVYKSAESGKLTHELIPNEDKEFDELIDEIEQSNNSDEKKFKWFVKELGDLKDELTHVGNTDEDNEDVEKMIDKIENILKEPKYQSFQPKDYPEHNVSPMFKTYHEQAEKEINANPNLIEDEVGKPIQTISEKIHKHRGNLSEDDIIEFDSDTGILKNIDRDNSDAFNTKDLIPYTDEFIKALLIDKYTGLSKVSNLPWSGKSSISDNDLNWLIKQYLSKVPVDAVKDGTIWELKSYTKPINKSVSNQQMTQTKIRGTNEFKMKLMKDNNGDFRIKNLYYGSNNIPMFKERPDGYKYYWLLSNKDKIGYVNPFKTKAFLNENHSTYTKEPNTYKAKWDKNLTNGDKIYLSNEDFLKYPKSYSKNFDKIIKKYKKNNP
jgi:hypothetical protein